VKLFIPAVGYRIKLTKDWNFDLYHESRNNTLLEKVLGTEAFDNLTYDWRKPGSTPACIGRDTVLEVDRVYVRTANKARTGEDDYDSVTFKVIDDTKKKCRFWAKLVDVNTIEYELPPNHTAGKDAAKERSTKRKKLDPHKIRDQISSACYTYTARRGGTPPSWFSKDVVNNLKKLETEYVRLFEPYERAKHEKALADRRAQLELDLATGKLSLPVGIASQVKSVDDLKKFGLYDNWFGNREFELRCATWDYILTYRVIGSYGYTGERVFSKMPDGTRCRTFRPAPPDKSSSWEKDAPDLSHMWVKVYTDVEGFDIIKIESGIDVR